MRSDERFSSCHINITVITGYISEVLIDPRTEEAKITVYYPNSYSLAEAEIQAYDFKLQSIPPLSNNVFPWLGFMASKIPVVDTSLKIYSYTVWVWNYISKLTSNKLIITINRDTNAVTIYWCRGLFNNNDFNGSIYIYDVYATNASGFGKPVTIIFEAEVADIHVKYNFTTFG